jgi:competence protein ComGC
MSENKNSNVTDNNVSKFSLVELLTILLLVGLIFVFFVPVNQARISRERVNGAINTINYISQKANEFKNNPDNGYYPDLSQLNLGNEIKSAYFDYTINPDDSTIVAVTTAAFGKKGAALVYSFSGKQYRVGLDDSDVDSKKSINENWIP